MIKSLAAKYDKGETNDQPKKEVKKEEKKEHKLVGSRKASKTSISNQDLPLANVKGFDFQETYKIVVNNEKKMNTDGKDVVIFLGVTQTGKSSTINALRGVKFAYDGEFLKVVDESKVAQVAKMGDKSGISTTKEPSIYQLDNGLLLIDTQGLFDTNEEEVVDIYEVSGSYLIQMALEKARSIRCICMIKYSDVLNGVVEFRKIGQFLQRFFTCVSNSENDYVPIHFLFNKFKCGEGNLDEYHSLDSEGRIKFAREQIKISCTNMIEGVQKSKTQKEYPYFHLFYDNINHENFSYVDATNDVSVQMLKNSLLGLRTIDKSYICINRFSRRRQRFEIEFENKIQTLNNNLKKNLIGLKYPRTLFDRMITLINDKVNILNNNIEAMSNFEISTLSEIQKAHLDKISRDYNDEYKTIIDRLEQDNKKYEEDLRNLEKLIESYDEVDENPIYNDCYDEAGFFLASKFVVDYPKYAFDDLPIAECKDEIGPDTKKEIICDEPEHFKAVYSSGGMGTKIKMAHEKGDASIVFTRLRCSVSIQLFTYKKNRRENLPTYQSLLAQKDQINKNIQDGQREIESNLEQQKQTTCKNVTDMRDSYKDLKVRISEKMNSMSEFYSNVTINMNELRSCISISKKLNMNAIPIDEMQRLNEQIEQLEAQNNTQNKIMLNDIEDILKQIDVDISAFNALENASLNLGQSSVQPSTCVPAQSSIQSSTCVPAQSSIQSSTCVPAQPPAQPNQDRKIKHNEKDKKPVGEKSSILDKIKFFNKK